MQIPGAQQLAPNVFSYTGHANTPAEVQAALANQTMARLQAHFQQEISLPQRAAAGVIFFISPHKKQAKGCQAS